MKVSGFSLLEVVLSIGVLVLIFSVSAPFYLRFQRRTELDHAVQTTVHALKRAQTLAQAVEGDTTWGVFLQSGSVILFQGSSYASRVISSDEIAQIPMNITISGTTEIVFAKLSGNLVLGSITTLSNSYDTRTITLSTKGVPSY